MGRSFQELASNVWAQLDIAMSDDNLLPLPRVPVEGEPNNWVAANYKNSWIKREKLLVVPELTGRGLLIGIVECDPRQATIKSGKDTISCQYIVDTPSQQNGPIFIAGRRRSKQVILSSTYEPQPVHDEIRRYLQHHAVEARIDAALDHTEAFAEFLSLILTTRSAFGIPLESSNEMLEAAESRCLAYLYADLIVRK